MLKSKIVVEQLEDKYRVVSLTNRTTPKIGNSISEKELQRILNDGRGKTTIDIKAPRA